MIAHLANLGHLVRLGLRLAVAGGRDAVTRLAVMAFGVAVGVTLLLLALTAQSAEQGRAERSGWLSADPDTRPDGRAADPALFLSVTDYHDGVVMSRAYVAALGDDPPVPPGLDRPPGPGELAVSPAMRRLLDELPDDQLDDRYPGRIVATIGDAGLAHPEAPVALIGRTPDQMLATRSDSLHTVRGFDSLPSGYAFVLATRLFMFVGAVLLLVPVVVFVLLATRVAAAQREQRLAAIRLVGATRSQAAVVAAIETGVAAVLGAAIGFGGYEIGRRIVAATLVFQGGHFFADDVVVQPRLLVGVLVGVPVLAMLTTVATLRRVGAGPVAVSRRGAPPPVSVRGVLLLGLGLCGAFALIPLRGVIGDVALDTAMAGLVVATIVGFLSGGPWLCLLAGRGLASISRGVPGLVAGRRLASDPHATFRAVAMVVLAAFAVTFSAGMIEPVDDPDVDGGPGVLRPGVIEVSTGGVPEEQVARLLAMPGAVAVRFDVGGAGEVVASCDELARVVEGRCSADDPDDVVHERPGLERSAPPVIRVLLPTDGTAAAENRARTAAASLLPNAIVHNQADRNAYDGDWDRDLGHLVRIGWQFLLIVAACGLTVGMIGGLVERRRPFTLLRASGLRLAELRRVVLLETAVAMIVTTAAGVVAGLVSSFAQARFQDTTWRWPDAGVFGTVGVGVFVALVLSLLALPMLDVATRPSTVRDE